MAKIISLKSQDILDYMLGKVELDSDFTDMPELKEKMDKVAMVHEDVLKYARKIYDSIKNIEDQKEFASHALNYKIRGILFDFRKGNAGGNLDIRWKKLEEYHESIVRPEPNKLIVLRGVPGCGKSTWIKENKLEKYVLCPDTLRLMFRAPCPHISQDNNSNVFSVFEDMLNTRMQNGDFTIIDATHCTNKSLKKYKEYCRIFGYEMEIKTFDITLSEALERNQRREEYKKVPEDVITRMHKQLNETFIKQGDN